MWIPGENKQIGGRMLFLLAGDCNFLFTSSVFCDIVGLKFESNQGGAVALLQRLYSIINKQMAEVSNISGIPEEKVCLHGTSSDAASHLWHEGWLTSKYMVLVLL